MQLYRKPSAQWPQNCPTANKEIKIQGRKTTWDTTESRSGNQRQNPAHDCVMCQQPHETGLEIIFPKKHKNPVKQGKVLHFRLRHTSYSFIFKATQNFEIIFHEASCATQDHLAIQSSLIPPQRRQHTLKYPKDIKVIPTEVLLMGQCLNTAPLPTEREPFIPQLYFTSTQTPGFLSSLHQFRYILQTG